MLDQRQRLRIMYDHEIVPDEIANAVFINHLFEDFFFDAGKIDLAALQRVMHLFGDREKIGRALNDTPFGLQAETVHEQRHGRKHLGHATAVIGRIEIGYVQIFELPGLLTDTLDFLASNERLVVFNLCDTITRHFLSDSFAVADTLANRASGD